MNVFNEIGGAKFFAVLRSHLENIEQIKDIYAT